MKPKLVKINDPNGLHLRTAAKIAEKAGQFDVTIKLCNQDKCASGSSVVELLMLDASQDDIMELEVSGSDAKQALLELSQFFIDGAGI